MGSLLSRMRAVGDYVGLSRSPPCSQRRANNSHPISFNRVERKRLRALWESIDDDELFGEMIFRRIFEAEPQLKAMFQWTNIPTEQLHANNKFRIHALNIVNVIDYCVDNVNNLQEKAGPKLRRLGSSHIRFQGFGMTGTRWEVFRISIMTTIQHQCEQNKGSADPDLVETWDKLITWIIRQMQFGFNGMKDRLQNEQTDFRTSMKIHEQSNMDLNSEFHSTPAHDNGHKME